MAELLAVEGLTAGYGEAVVLEDVALTLEEGDSLALLGRNGMGKTTLLVTLMGLTRMRGGTLRWRGRDLAAMPTHRRSRAGIGWVPQERFMFPSLTVEEHLTAVARPGPWNVAQVYEIFPRLADRRTNFGNQLSGGEQQMLAIGRALMVNPALLLLDEPMEGLAPIIVQELMGVIRELVEDGGMAVIVVEQHAKLALSLTRQAIVLERGRVVHRAASEALLRDPGHAAPSGGRGVSGMRRTQVAIVGAGPSGLLLGQLLQRAGIDNVILERHTGDYVLGRIRAGVLEQGTVAMLDEAGVGARAARRGSRPSRHRDRLERRPPAHRLRRAHRRQERGRLRPDRGHPGPDGSARGERRGVSVYEAEDVSVHGFDGNHPMVRYRHGGTEHELACDFIAGCDGFHGVCRKSVPAAAIDVYEREYPFGWLGLLSDTPPVSDELIYVSHERGFALCSMRSHTRSRYYLQCPLDERVEAWPDERFWDGAQVADSTSAPSRISSPARRSRRASRHCGASSPSRCASAACSSPATPRTSCRRRAPRD